MKCMLGKDWLVLLVLDEKWEQRGLASHSVPKYNAEAIRRFHLSPGKLLQLPLRASTGVRHTRGSFGAELNRIVFLCSSTGPESRLVTKGLWSYLGLLNGLTVTGMDSLLWCEARHPSESGESPRDSPATIAPVPTPCLAGYSAVCRTHSKVGRFPRPMPRAALIYRDGHKYFRAVRWPENVRLVNSDSFPTRIDFSLPDVWITPGTFPHYEICLWFE